MKNFIYKILGKFKFTSYPLQIYALSRLYLNKIGWIKSKHLNLPVDQKGQPIPWITYGAIHLLADRITKDFKVFEYGSGYSTLWFAEKVQSIKSIEYDKGFYEFIQAKIKQKDNVEYLQRELRKNYNQEISKHSNEFDLIVIDGRERIQCALNSVNALKEDGVILWDNSERPDYLEGIERLKKMGFKQIPFRGLAPAAVTESETSIFYRTNNCLGL